MRKSIRLHCLVVNKATKQVSYKEPIINANNVAEATFILQREALKMGLVVLSVVTDAQVENKISKSNL